MHGTRYRIVGPIAVAGDRDPDARAGAVVGTALRRAMAELGLRAGTIVTRGEEETISAGAGAIDVVPAWRFLLDVG